MELPSRRAVLGGGLAAGTAPLLAGCSDDRNGLDPADWSSVRAQFAIPQDLLHFSAYVFAAHPAPVRAAIERHRAGFDADAIGHLHKEEVAREGAVRGAAAGYLGARPAEIALTDSTTMGLGLLYGGIRLRPGQEALTTEHDFYSTHMALRQGAERSGASVRRIRLYDDPAKASADEIVSRLRAAIGPRTRVVALTWVHSVTGVKLPIREIAAVVAAANRGRASADRALLCVDAVHGLGVENATVRELGCDFLVAGTHKWLFGPRGTGIVYGRESAWPALSPLIPSFAGRAFGGWLGDRPVDTDGFTATPGGYHSAEHRWALAEAFAFHRKIGKDRVQARTHDQATRLKAGLAALPGVTVVTPREPALSSGVVCCEVRGQDPDALVTRLRREHRIVASVTPYRERYLRFGPSIVTTPEQVDQVVRALKNP